MGSSGRLKSGGKLLVVVRGSFNPVKVQMATADYAKKHGMANVCRLILNSNEFLFVP